MSDPKSDPDQAISAYYGVTLLEVQRLRQACAMAFDECHRTALAEQSRLNAEREAEAYRRGVEVLARSDAQFDGRDFDGLGRADRKRYLDRSAAGLAAIRSLPADKEGA